MTELCQTHTKTWHKKNLARNLRATSTLEISPMRRLRSVQPCSSALLTPSTLRRFIRISPAESQEAAISARLPSTRPNAWPGAAGLVGQPWVSVCKGYWIAAPPQTSPPRRASQSNQSRTHLAISAALEAVLRLAKTNHRDSHLVIFLTVTLWRISRLGGEVSPQLDEGDLLSHAKSALPRLVCSIKQSELPAAAPTA